jgi:hypothetical protein
VFPFRYSYDDGSPATRDYPGDPSNDEAELIGTAALCDCGTIVEPTENDMLERGRDEHAGDLEARKIDDAYDTVQEREIDAPRRYGR